MGKENELFEKIGNALEESVQGKLFGKPCLKINGKAFVCFYEDEMVFKLKGETHTAALDLEDAQLFDPSGKKRPMKEWVQVPFKHKSLWKKYAESAMEYVLDLTK